MRNLMSLPVRNLLADPYGYRVANCAECDETITSFGWLDEDTYEVFCWYCGALFNIGGAE